MTTALIEDQEIALFQQWLANGDDAPPCVLPDCDEPAAHKWTLQPCGCVWLLCNTHHRFTVEIQKRGFRTRYGARVRCDILRLCGVILTGGTHYPI